MIFVCANARGPGERISCAGEGRCGLELLEVLKKYVKDNKLQDVVRVTKSGCQEKCEAGPNICIFTPGQEDQFLSAVSASDIDAIINKYLILRGGVLDEAL